MAKYKPVDEKIVEGFMEKMFGRIVTKAGQQVAADIAKKDPKFGSKFKRLNNMIKDIEKDLKGKTKAQQAKYKRDLFKAAGIK